MKTFITQITRKNEMIQTIVGLGLIGIFLSGAGLISGNEVIPTLRDSFLSAYFIGLSIIALIHLLKPYEIEPFVLQWAAFFSIFVIGGWIGAYLMYLTNRFVFQLPLNNYSFRDWMPSVTFFAVFFGTVFGGYTFLRDKLNESVEKLAAKEINEQNLLRLKTKAELEALRSKANPHFLFNTLNSIASLIPEDQQKAEDMVLKLSDLLRYTLNASSHDTVTLSEELEAVTKYLGIEKIRLGKKLDFSMEMDDSVADQIIPGLILQPLVENSIKHGIAPKREGGKVTVRCTRDDDICRMEIIDTGNGFDAMNSGGGFGLQGVRDRLELLYPGRHQFTITSNNGVHIVIELPVSS